MMDEMKVFLTSNVNTDLNRSRPQRGHPKSVLWVRIIGGLVLASTLAAYFWQRFHLDGAFTDDRTIISQPSSSHSRSRIPEVVHYSLDLSQSWQNPGTDKILE